MSLIHAIKNEAGEYFNMGDDTIAGWSYGLTNYGVYSLEEAISVYNILARQGVKTKIEQQYYYVKRDGQYLAARGSGTAWVKDYEDPMIAQFITTEDADVVIKAMHLMGYSNCYRSVNYRDVAEPVRAVALADDNLETTAWGEELTKANEEVNSAYDVIRMQEVEFCLSASDLKQQFQPTDEGYTNYLRWCFVKGYPY